MTHCAENLMICRQKTKRRAGIKRQPMARRKKKPEANDLITNLMLTFNKFFLAPLFLNNSGQKLVSHFFISLESKPQQNANT